MKLLLDKGLSMNQIHIHFEDDFEYVGKLPFVPENGHVLWVDATHPKSKEKKAYCVKLEWLVFITSTLDSKNGEWQIRPDLHKGFDKVIENNKVSSDFK
jgi:hypothetical protein